MTGPGRSGPVALPHGAVHLLDDWSRLHPSAGVRVWTSGEAGWLCVYPESGASDSRPGSARAPIAGGRTAYHLELNGRYGDESRRFLLAALAQVFAYEGEAESAAHELSERYEEINLLYTIAEILASFLSMEEATTRILEEVTDVLGARRAALWVANPGRNRLVLTAAVGDEGSSGPIALDDDSSITARVFRDRQPINLEAGAPLPGPGLEAPLPHGEEPYLSVPVSFTPPDGTSRTVGVITLVGRRTDVRFNASDLRLLTAIASQVGAALETQRLLRESLRRERFERELELAHRLQLKLLPDASRFEAARVAARCAPAESVGGDLYHLFELGHERVGVVIGDVSGHGFSAAMIMALTMSAIAIYSQEATQPGEVMRRVHQALIDELETTEMYLTILFVVVDRSSREVLYSNAGHPHAFVVRPDGAAHRLGATSPPLGTTPLADYGEERVEWGPDDLLLLFTDGLSDAFTGEAGISGEQHLLAEVRTMGGADPATILERIFGMASTGHTVVPPDDRTAVLLRS
jgi:phosphoserine phosphatase RsbU/P